MPRRSLSASSSLTFLVLAVAPVLADIAASGSPEGNDFLSPSNGEALPQAKAVTARWTPTTPGPVSLLLCKDSPTTAAQPQVLYSLAEGIANTGSFTWTPSEALPAGLARYKLKLIDMGAGKVQYSKSFLLYPPDTVDRRMAPPGSEAPPFPVQKLQPSTHFSAALGPLQAPR